MFITVNIVSLQLNLDNTVKIECVLADGVADTSPIPTSFQYIALTVRMDYEFSMP